MVRHIREDIDQFFSAISKHLKQQQVIININCPDLQSFVEEVRKSFSDSKEIPQTAESSFLLSRIIFFASIEEDLATILFLSTKI